ncbi:MAG: transcriptional regulator, putative ATPase, winged helix family [Ilumatobacteraceae bacterium]|nr:transcriptional regulator, putative ATPase, winged helix family [Ilumatobacteraceae bacterium]
MATDPSRTTEPLELCVLGPLRAHRGATALALGGRQQRAVLTRLALAGSRSVSAERLADELWSGEPPPSAVNTLQSYVSNLRRILGSSPAGTTVIERVGDGYRLALAPGAYDADRFESLVAQSSRTETPALDRVALLDEALALWQGPALAEFASEPWAQGDAVRLEEMRVAAMEARFELLLELGRHATVVGDLELAAIEHPLRERFTFQLITALYRCGRQAEALRAFERTRAHLGEELGLDPSPELARLADAVLAHDPSLALEVSATRSSAGSLAVTVPRAPGERLPLPPAVIERRTRSGFVGRRSQLAVLRSVWMSVADPSRHGEVTLVALEGEPGVGKTRLVQHLARVVHDDGGQVFWGRCTPESLVAHQPFVEALRTAARSVEPDEARASVAARPALAVLLPEWVDAPAAESTGARAERWELYEAVTELLEDSAAVAPVLLVLDDLQWADAATLALLDHLVHQDRVGRLLVVATVRRPAGRPTAELDRLLSDARRDGRLTTVGVAGFEVDEVIELLDDRGRAVSSDAAAALRDRTGGNPFFIESLVDNGGDLDPADPRAVPDSVRDVLDQRLTALDTGALAVLSAAAVIGLRVDLGVLGTVAGLSPDALLDVVDVAVATGLLVEDEDIGWVTFPHALVQQALVARITRNREAQLHLRIADAIESRPPEPDHATTVAQHLLAAGRLADPVRTTRAALAAGHEALAALADVEAGAWAERVATLLEAPTARGEDVWQLRVDGLLLSMAASRYIGDVGGWHRALDAIAEAAQEGDDAGLLLVSAVEAALGEASRGFPYDLSPVNDRLERLLDDALDRIPEERVGDRALALGWHSLSLSGTDLREEERQRTRLALSLLDQLEDHPSSAAVVLFAHRNAFADPARLQDRVDFHVDLIRYADASDDHQVAGLYYAAVDLLEAGRLPEARVMAERLGAVAAPHGRPWYDAYASLLFAMFAHLEGRGDEAEALTAAGMRDGLPAHAGEGSQFDVGRRLLFARRHGRYAELRGWGEALVARHPGQPAWRTTAALAQLADGDRAAARASARTVLGPDGLTIGDDSLVWYLVVDQLAELCWAEPAALGAAALATAIEPYADRIGVLGMGSLPLGSMRLAHGRALAAAGDLDAADAVLARTATEAEALGFHPDRARALLARADVLELRGRPGDQAAAGELRQTGTELADRLAMARPTPLGA